MSTTDITIKEAGVEITLSVPNSSDAAASSAAPASAPPLKRARVSSTCAVCALAVAKYTCPRCSVRTCSLACVRAHKRDTGCNGQRDKTAFVSIKQMNANHLVSDLHFLEEVEHNSERARTHLNNVIGSHSHQVEAPALRRKRKKASSCNDGGQSTAGTSDSTAASTSAGAGAGAAAAAGTSADDAAVLQTKSRTSKDSETNADEMLHQNKNSETGGGPRLPTALLQKRTRREKLLTDAALVRKTELVLLSAGMQRRKENSSYWNRKEDVIYWRIVWHAGKDGSAIIMDGADERNTIASLARDFPRLTSTFKPCAGEAGDSSNSSSSSSSNNVTSASTSVAEMRYYLRKARCPANDQRYYDLGDGEVRLKDVLKNRTIVEHPVIRVCSEGDVPVFE